MNNVIIMYKGGGYDGCFWEYNVMLKFNDELHNVYTSGIDGMPLFKKADRIDDDCREDMTKALRWAKAREYWLVRLDSQESIDQMIAQIPADFVKDVLNLVSGITNEEYDVVCGVCGRHAEVDEMELSDPRGCGGIMSCCDDFICPQCISSGTCRVCGSYVDEENIRGEACSSCIRDALDKDTAIRDTVRTLEAVILRGEKQLTEMCKLRPSRARSYKTQHMQAKVAIEQEIDALCAEAVEYY